jgi:hypothetical protein
MPSTEPVGSDPAPRPKHRTFTSEYKLRIVAEYDAAPRNEKGAVGETGERLLLNFHNSLNRGILRLLKQSGVHHRQALLVLDPP